MTVENDVECKVQVGPDLNSSKSPLDKKLYRQIILDNGLRVVLISDTVAMNQGGPFLYEDDEDESMESEDEEMSIAGNNDEADDDDNDEDDDEEEEDDDGLRKAAAAIVVGAGSYYDPPWAQGIAHFLEHMLFMGTSKYPKENEYDAFLSKNGGSDNAYTELEHTLYHFEICQEKLFEALDMLAQFFIDPLMLQDAVDRELQSIESEFQLSKNSDDCRLQQLLCHVCDCQDRMQHNEETKVNDYGESFDLNKHPFGSFSWGNMDSLKVKPKQNGIDIMNELRNFYNQHYYAQNMGLVIVGAYSLDELERRVSKCFELVPALPRTVKNVAGEHDSYVKVRDAYYKMRQIKRDKAGSFNVEAVSPIEKCGMPFQPESLGTIFRIIPVKDRHSLTITWQIPPQWSNWKSKPCDYIAHLIGHEASGSLLSLLKDKLWVNACYAGVGSDGYENASSHALFTVTLTLAEKGVQQWQDIISYVYVYIGMLRFYCHSSQGLPRWIFEELKVIHELTYKYQDEPSPSDLVEDIAESMSPYIHLPPERLLDGDSLLFEFDTDLIRDLLDNHFRPENSRIDIISSTFGRAADFLSFTEGPPRNCTAFDIEDSDAGDFCVETAGEPNVEHHFGTSYWCHKIPNDILDHWKDASQPQLPPSSSSIFLPPINPFVPNDLELKSTPPDDTNHPLLYCSLKICVSNGKRKSWFPCTVTKYDSTKNRVLLSSEDEDEEWHFLDNKIGEINEANIKPGFESTMDKKAIKFRVIAVPKDGEGAVFRYGDESDWDVEEGVHFPPIPPPLPQARLPQLVYNTKLLKVWHLQDRKFKRPVAELRINIVCSDANKTAVHRGCADLLVLLCTDATTEICYLATCTELGSSISSTDTGFMIRFYGYNDKLLSLAEKFLGVFFSFASSKDSLPPSIKANRFSALLEVLLRKYGNSGLNVSSLCTDVRLRCIRPSIPSSHAKAKAMEKITEQSFSQTIYNMLQKVSIDSFFHGNVDKTDVIAARELILNVSKGSMGIAKNKQPIQHVMMIPSSVHKVEVPTIDPNEPNSGVEFYVQVGKDNVLDRSIIDLLVHMIYEPMFDVLRTKEQLGYSVSCAVRWTNGIMGFCFKVISSSKSADDITSRLEKFLIDYREDLISITDEAFMENVIALAKSKLETFNCLEEECGYLWSEITDNRFDWEAYRNEVIALRSLSKKAVIDSYDKWLYPKQNDDSRKMFIVQVVGDNERDRRLSLMNEERGAVQDGIESKVDIFHNEICQNRTFGRVNFN